MKINIIATLLFALQASTATGLAIATIGPCEDYDIQTEQECVAKCNGIFGGNWEGSVSGPADEITECMCTATKEDTATKIFKCTRERTPEPPVQTTESCETQGIESWDDCRDHCITLTNGRRFSARVEGGNIIEGGKGNISACYCTYGPNLENSYTCNRTPTPPPPFPEQPLRGLKCSANNININNQEQCFSFCTEHKRLAKYAGSANGPVRCLCQDVQGGPSVWECTGNNLRSRL
jgi:hypothetical protein